MARASLTITHASIGGAKTISARVLAVGFKRNTEAKPNVNGGSMAKVQTQSQENMTYSLNGVTFTGATGELTYADLLTLAKLNYDGTNAPTLAVAYGRGNAATSLIGFDGVTTAIKVIIKDFSGNFDTSDSDGAYRPSFTVNLVETG